MHLYRIDALHKAQSQIGVKENPAGSNHGVIVDRYQEADNAAGTGYPWCASFMNWIFREVGRPLVELNLSASVGELLALARSEGWVVTKAQKGDLVCYDWNTLTGPGQGDWPDHIGILESISPSGFSLTCIEGNTAVGNDSNGGAVMRRADRTSQMVEAYIRVPGGYEFDRHWDVRRGNDLVADYKRRWRAVRKVKSVSKNLAFGERVTLAKVQRRIERKGA